MYIYIYIHIYTRYIYIHIYTRYIYIYIYRRIQIQMKQFSFNTAKPNGTYTLVSLILIFFIFTQAYLKALRCLVTKISNLLEMT